MSDCAASVSTRTATPTAPDVGIIADARERSSNDPEDRLLRISNGIRDEAVFPLLRTAFAEDELHAVVMSMIRTVQYGHDHTGAIAKFLGVVRTGINGTTAAPEVG